MLKKRGIKHEVLNAKYHEKEAEIIAQAGKKDAVTIATNMAGRGTDIMLGGNVEYMTKAELRREGFSEELIAESNGHAETDNEEILEVRRRYNELEATHKDVGGKAGRGSTRRGRFVYHRHRASRKPPHRQPAARPCGPSGRPPVLRAFSSAWRTT